MNSQDCSNVGGHSKGLNTDDTKNVREIVIDWWKMASISSWTY